MVETIAAEIAQAGASRESAEAETGVRPKSFLTARAKARYAAGDMVDGVIANAVNTFLLFYLNAACGMPGSLAGLALALTLIVDAVADPAIGYWSDNSRSKWGRRHPFMLISAIPMAIGLGLIFSIPKELTGGALFAYVLAVLLLLRISMSAFTLPFIAMGAELSDHYTERSSIVAYRSGFNIIANCGQIVLGLWVFLYGAASLKRAAYVPYGWSCAAIALTGALVASLGTLSLRGRLHRVAARKPEDGALDRILREIREVFSNRSFRMLFACVLIFWIAWGTLGALALYANKFFWGLPPDVIKTIPLFLILGLATGILVAATLLGRFEKRQVCVGGLLAVCLLVALPPPLRIVGLIPAGGMPLYAILAVLNVLIGWTVSCVAISFFSMMADAADEHELLFGSRREGSYFAGLTFSAKAATALGALIAGVGLDAIHFPRDLATAGDHPIAQGTLNALGLIQGTGCGLFAAVSILALARYNLDAKKHAAIHAELAQRRTGG